MKIINKHCWLFVYLIVLFTGCSKDFEYVVDKKDVSYFSVTRPLDTVVQIFRLDNLEIKPTIAGLKESETSYSYEWLLYGTSSGTERILLSTERNLKTQIVVDPGNYYLTFSIMDNATKVREIKLYNITVNGKFYEGWFITNNLNGVGRLSFLRQDDEVFLDPLKDVNGIQYPGKALNAFVSVNTSSPRSSDVFYVTDNGLTSFEANTLLQTREKNELLSAIPADFSNTYYAMSGLGADQYFVSGGNIYAALGPIFGETNLGTFSERIEGDYTVFPYVFLYPGNGATQTHFYDNKNKRFISMAFTDRLLSFPTANVNTAQGITLDRIGKELLRADYTLGYQQSCLMRDVNGYYLYHIAYSTNGSITQISYVNIGNAPDIAQVSGFTTSTRYQHAYYAAGSSIYKIDGLSGTVTPVYTFADGSAIADLKMYKLTNRSFQLAPSNELHNKVLVVATNKGDDGQVHYIYLDNLGNRDADRSNKNFTGFGKINTLTYRNTM